MTTDEYNRYIDELVSAAPPLKPEQLARLSALFNERGQGQ